MEHNQGAELEKIFPNYAISLQLGQPLWVPASFLVTMTVVAGPELKTAIANEISFASDLKKKRKGNKESNFFWNK